MSDVLTLPLPSTTVLDSYALESQTPNRADRILETVQRWHDGVHAGPFQHCYEQPCHATQRAADEGDDICPVCTDRLVCTSCDMGGGIEVE
jgi:hypothetical protein